MGTTIVIRNGSTLPSQGSGITLAEPAFNTDLRTFHIGLGHGTTAEWIGAPISGASGTIASAEAYKIPTAKAVKDYVTDYVTAVNGVLTVNGFAGGVTLTAGTGMSVAAASGTLTLTNEGVQSFNGATGAVQGVSSVQGRTGAVGICGGVGIAVPNAPTGNTLSVSLNYISGGTAMSVRKTVDREDWLAFQDNTGLNPMYRAQVRNLSYTFLGTLTNRLDSGSSATYLRISSALDDTNKVATDEYITVGDLFTAYGDYVTSFNGRTGAVQGVSAAVAGTGISVSGATGAVTITNTGVQSFNGLTGAVQGVSSWNGQTGAVSFVNYVSSFNGITGDVTGVCAAAAGTGISVSGSTGTVTITNTGVQSFNGLTGSVEGVRYVNGRTGSIVILGGTNIGVTTSGVILTVNNEGVLSVDGATGAVNNVARTNTANTFTQLQTFSNVLGISAAQVQTKTIVTPTDALTLQGTVLSGSPSIKFPVDDGLGGTYYSTFKVNSLSADRTVSLPDAAGTLALTSQLMGAVNGSTAATTAVTSFNGLTGSVQGVSSVNGQTGAVTISSSTDVVTSFNGRTGAVQGVSAAVAGSGISVSAATGAVTITNTGVQSFNGNTGAVTGASLGANTFSGVNSFTVGISSAGITTDALHVRAAGSGRFLEFIPGTNNQIIARGNSTLNLFQEVYNSIYIGDFDAANNATYVEVDDSNQIIKFYFNGDYYTFPTASGTVGQVLGIDSANTLGWRSSVSSFNGATGAVGISAGSGITITQSGTTFTIASTASGGGISRSIYNVTGATTAGSAANTDYVYNGTSGPYAITMPTAVSNTNRYTIKNSGVGTISVYTTSSQTIDGVTFYNLTKQYSAIDLLSDGSNWFVV